MDNPRPSQSPVSGTERRHFRIHGCLGRGGFGEVYRATMESSAGVSTEVAVKVLRADIDPGSDSVKRLRDEGRLLGKLSHPSILKVHDLVLLEGRVALVTEYIDGQDLDGCFHTPPYMPARVLLSALGEVASALDAAWRSPSPTTGGPLHLIHRDVKPANIRLGRHGEVKLLDFGIARATNVVREAQTAHDAMMGSYPYMAPERFQEDAVETPSDVFSLGCILYEGLTRQRFYGEATLKQVYAAVIHSGKYRRLLEDRLALVHTTPAIQEVLWSLLDLDPAGRPEAGAFAARCEDLAEELEGPTLKRWARDRAWPSAPHFQGSLDGKTLTAGSFLDGTTRPALQRSWTPPQGVAATSLATPNGASTGERRVRQAGASMTPSIPNAPPPPGSPAHATPAPASPSTAGAVAPSYSGPNTGIDLLHSVRTPEGAHEAPSGEVGRPRPRANTNDADGSQRPTPPPRNPTPKPPQPRSSAATPLPAGSVSKAGRELGADTGPSIGGLAGAFQAQNEPSFFGGGPDPARTEPEQARPARRRGALAMVLAGLVLLLLASLIVAPLSFFAAKMLTSRGSTQGDAAGLTAPAPAPAAPAPAPAPVAPAPVAPAPVAPAPVAPAPVAPAPVAPVAAPVPAEPKPAPKPSGPSAASASAKGWELVSSDPEAAMTSFTQALTIQPGFADAEYGMGYVLMQQGNPAEAGPFLCRAAANGTGDTKREVQALLTRNSLACE